MKGIADEFYAVGVEITTAPLPDVRGLSWAERYKVIGARVKADADKYRSVVDKLRGVTPPPGYEQHKRAFTTMIEGTMQKTRAWADAIMSGDTERAFAAMEAIDAHLLQAMDEVIRASEGLGLDASRLKAQRKDMEAILKRN